MIGTSGKVAISGYFDPIHVGHLEFIRMAKKLGSHLTVIVNNDHQAKLKKGRSFMNEQDRMEIVYAIKGVDQVVLSIDKDKTVNETLRMLKPNIFANGGDRTFDEAPENILKKEWDLKLVDGLGKKIRSSSEMTGIK